MAKLSTIIACVALIAVPAAASACAAPTPVAPSPSSTLTPTAPIPDSAPSPNQRPADVLDLTNWYLTLPTGAQEDPDTVHQPGLAAYSSTYFRLNDAKDGVVFTANAGGATTSGSKYPRSELREMIADEKASWSNESGTHTLSVRQAVTTLPPAKPEVVTAQIHDSTDDVMLVRLEGERLIVQYDDGDSEITLDPAYKLGTAYDLKIVAADSRVEVYYNGARLADIKKSGSGWYFKSGSYLQSNTSKGDDAGAIGEVVIYQLQVTHSP